MNKKQLIISYESFLKQDNEDKYNMLEEAVNEIERLNNKIEKAVEYLKDNAKYQKVSINNNKYYSEYLINQVLDILDGSDE